MVQVSEQLGLSETAWSKALILQRAEGVVGTAAKGISSQDRKTEGCPWGGFAHRWLHSRRNALCPQERLAPPSR